MRRLQWAITSLPLIVVLAFGFRVGGILILRTYNFPTDGGPFATTPPEFGFGSETGSIAASLARGQGFSSPFGHPTGPTAWIAPIYPVLVAAFFKVFGIYTKPAAIAVLTLNSLFSAITCVPIVSAGRRTVGAPAGFLAAWIWAVVPIFMKWPISWVWDMSLSGLLVALLLLSTLEIVDSHSRKLWLGYGCLWGFAALTNPALLSTLPLSLLWLVVKRRRIRQVSPLLFGVVVIALVGCTAPWIIRNCIMLGKPTFIRDNFWFEFHLGNYHLSNGMGWVGKHPTGNIIELDLYKKLGELEYVRHYRYESITFVRTHPDEFLQLTEKRFVTYWTGDFFHYRWWETPSYLSLSFLALMGLILALGNGTQGALLLGNILLFYPVVYYLTYPFPRYRHAIEPEMLLLSSYFLCELIRNFLDRFRQIAATSSETVNEEWITPLKE